MLHQIALTKEQKDGGRTSQAMQSGKADRVHPGKKDRQQSTRQMHYPKFDASAREYARLASAGISFGYRIPGDGHRSCSCEVRISLASKAAWVGERAPLRLRGC